MKLNGDFELSDVPGQMERWERSGKNNAGALMAARAGLLDACETMMETAMKESRGLTADEQRSFDGHRAQIGEINAALAEFKAARVAEHGADLVHVPF